jgi:hypothetical protein
LSEISNLLPIFGVGSGTRSASIGENQRSSEASEALEKHFKIEEA